MATQWWVRPRPDGGCDYVRLCRSPADGSVEVIEGSHLPPQLPLLKRRQWISAEAVSGRGQQLQAFGYRPGAPLF
mgnify:CR=1 FL=1|jgi:hypothetical protein